MSPEETLQQLDNLIERRSILEHPFYQAWRAGELARDQLAVYSKVYYPHVAAFPGYLRIILDQTGDELVRAELKRNLMEELGTPKPHNELWLDFASGLGIHPDSITITPPSLASKTTVESFESICSYSTEAGLAALYAYESQQPLVARQKADGLSTLYGITDPAALAYFEVHAEADLEHRAGERRAIGHILDTSPNPEQTGQVILDAAAEALDAYWLLLDGVCEQTSIAI